MIGNSRIYYWNERNPLIVALKDLLQKALESLPEDELDKYYRERRRPRRAGKSLWIMTVIRKQTSILDLAVIVSTALERANITAVLSGGAAVSIYTDNRYKSMDLDFVSTAETKVIEAALVPLGFKRQDGSRYFTHDDTD